MGSEAIEERRIWLGNLDTRLTDGPLAGQSRGYAFVTFKSAESSLTALHKLNGQYVGKKPLAVRLAKNLSYDELEKPKPRIEIPALGTRPPDAKISKEDAIRAIEAKLNVLEKRTLDEDLDISNNCTFQTPLIQKYQFNKNNDVNAPQKAFGTRMQYVKHRSSSGPYNRNHRPKRR